MWVLDLQMVLQLVHFVQICRWCYCYGICDWRRNAIVFEAIGCVVTGKHFFFLKFNNCFGLFLVWDFCMWACCVWFWIFLSFVGLAIVFVFSFIYEFFLSFNLIKIVIQIFWCLSNATIGWVYSGVLKCYYSLFFF